MNKRVLMRGGAFVAATALVATSLCEGVMAASKAELAKNIDDFSFKTVAYKTEATTDGGYIVGGKTIVCIQESFSIDKEKKVVAEDGEYKIVELENCANQVVLEDLKDEQPVMDGLNVVSEAVDDEEQPTGTTNEGNAEEGNAEEGNAEEGGADAELVDLTPLFEELCSSQEALASFSNSKKLAADDDHYYSYRCVDYMAKYTSAGKSVWVTPIFDRDDILGVGESNIDYRLVTMNGRVYTFDKTSGDEDYFDLQIDYTFYNDSSLLVNSDGSMIVSDDGDLGLFGKTGRFIRWFEPDDGWKYSSSFIFNIGGMATSGGKVLAYRYKEDSSSDLGEKMEIVEISSDLTTAKKRISGLSGSIENGTVTQRVPLGGNKQGDMVVLMGTGTLSEDDEDTEWEYRYESYDKNNKLIGTTDLSKDIDKIFINNYVAVDMDLVFGRGGDIEPLEVEQNTKVTQSTAEANSIKFYFYSRTLEYIGAYTPASEEEINDLTVLNNGTLVAVGATQEETSPNGLRAHLAGATSSNPTTNPNTFDNIQLVAILSGAAVLGAAVLTRKKLVRR